MSRRRSLTLLAAGLLCFPLAACGGSGSTSTDTAPAESADAKPGHASFGPLTIGGGGSGQFVVPGGDNSVQEYGEEAGEAELREAAEAVHAYFVARVTGEWARACGFLSAVSIESLEQAGSRSPKASGKGCPGALDLVTKAVSPSLTRALTTVDAASLRSEGSQAFLIYTGPPGRTVYAMPLREEDGAWKLGAISGAVLPGT